ncbi:MAG: hypothetical protein WB706_11535, partial [Nitrososphaeraceae archaeon]
MKKSFYDGVGASELTGGNKRLSNQYLYLTLSWQGPRLRTRTALDLHHSLAHSTATFNSDRRT